ncbi:hypothetical protein K1719_044010 [Acacia pycnantha]|nr:hypothetical protein K1719_044010 [Acacia pycnantha]
MLGGIQPRGRKSLRKLMQESQPVISFPKHRGLGFSKTVAFWMKMFTTLKCFQNVQHLDLSRNDFVSLPKCIKECANMRILEIYNCKRLRDIPELPSGLHDIRAENCTSLTTESLDDIPKLPSGLHDIRLRDIPIKK